MVGPKSMALFFDDSAECDVLLVHDSQVNDLAANVDIDYTTLESRKPVR